MRQYAHDTLRGTLHVMSDQQWVAQLWRDLLHDAGLAQRWRVAAHSAMEPLPERVVQALQTNTSSPPSERHALWISPDALIAQQAYLARAGAPPLMLSAPDKRLMPLLRAHTPFPLLNATAASITTWHALPQGLGSAPWSRVAGGRARGFRAAQRTLDELQHALASAQAPPESLIELSANVPHIREEWVAYCLPQACSPRSRVAQHSQPCAYGCSQHHSQRVGAYHVIFTRANMHQPVNAIFTSPQAPPAPHILQAPHVTHTLPLQTSPTPQALHAPEMRIITALDEGFPTASFAVNIESTGESAITHADLYTVNTPTSADAHCNATQHAAVLHTNTPTANVSHADATHSDRPASVRQSLTRCIIQALQTCPLPACALLIAVTATASIALEANPLWCSLPLFAAETLPATELLLDALTLAPAHTCTCSSTHNAKTYQPDAWEIRQNAKRFLSFHTNIEYTCYL